jgi:hypothetical protein
LAGRRPNRETGIVDDTDKIALRTDVAISGALDKMVADLPETVAPQAALEEVVRGLAIRQPWFMRLIMEDPDIRETYDATVALMPATARV